MAGGAVAVWNHGGGLSNAHVLLPRRRSGASSYFGGCPSLSWPGRRKECPLLLARVQPQRQPQPPQTQEDVVYLTKLFLGCAAGAGVIKYGSLLAPGITKPNFVLALSMIGVPMIVAIVFLSVGSFSERKDM